MSDKAKGEQPVSDKPYQPVCFFCYGRGKKGGKPCAYCRGTGKMSGAPEREGHR